MKQLEGWGIELTKTIKKKLSIKIFLITFCLFILVCGGTFLCISKIMPYSYSDKLIKDVKIQSSELVEKILKCNEIRECIPLFLAFEKETGASIWLDDEYGNTVYPEHVVTENGIVITEAYAIYDENDDLRDNNELTENNVDAYPISLRDGSTYTLVVQTDLLVVRQSIEVLWSILPLIVLVVFILSISCAILFSGYITQPILKLCSISERMASLDFTEKCDETRSDELGYLAHNLNFLSDSLSCSIAELKKINEQLRTDIEKEHEIERQRVEFFRAASHELKTPLTILKGHLTGMLNDVKGYENHVKYLQRSLSVTEKMESLIQELLYTSKIESNKKNTVGWEMANLSVIIKDEIAGLIDFAKEKRLLIDLDIPEKMECFMEKNGISRAIQNILVNAIRYSPEEAKIIVKAKEESDEINCSIENTDTTIPECAIPHIFDAFYRVDSSRNRNMGGTGLGLYIVREILEGHGASYNISNTEGGVCFSFTMKQNK